MSEEKEAQTENKSKKKNSCFAWGFGCLGLMILLLSLVLNGFLGLALAAYFSSENLISEQQYYNEKNISGSVESENKIAVIHINGVIAHRSLDQNIFSTSLMSVEDIAFQLAQARDDENVKSVILYIDSPGGTDSASDYLYHEVMKFKATGKSLVAFYSETAASGAYYVSVPADLIYAEPSCLVGSIGVVLSHLNIEGLYDKIGIKEEVFKSGDLKDIMSSTREMTDEEKEIIQELVDESKGRFEGIVKKHRQINESDFETIFDSRIFSAKQAKQYGLIDEIGYFDDAILETALLDSLDDYQVVEYEYQFSWSEIFSGLSSLIQGKDISSEVKEIMMLNQPRMMFLWK